MNFDDITHQGPAIDDPTILDRLSPAHRELLRQCNGLVAFGGGLHIRGACLAPDWHALRAAWDGPRALHALYRAVLASDVPFAEDALGDQFLLRDGVVHQLGAETGRVVSLDLELYAFLEASCADPVGFLQLAPLRQFGAEGGHLEPGQLLSVFPPLCTAESAAGVSVRAVSSADLIGWLAEFAAQVQDLPDGTRVQIKLAP